MCCSGYCWSAWECTCEEVSGGALAWRCQAGNHACMADAGDASDSAPDAAPTDDAAADAGGDADVDSGS